jgi:hypothetical protein
MDPTAASKNQLLIDLQWLSPHHLLLPLLLHVAHISNDISDEDGEDSEDENLGIAAVDVGSHIKRERR